MGVAFAAALVALTSGLPVSGCSPLNDPNVPEPIRAYTEPSFGADYLLYRPSSYDRRDDWPLIVVCHGGFPDSPARCLRDWTQLAERYGFLVVAPQLTGTRGATLLTTDQVRARLDADERRILSILQHVGAGQSISADRVFVHGCEGGARAALNVGLRHPKLFRAISVSAPDFDEAHVGGTGVPRDAYQHVLVQHGGSDLLTGRDAERCVEWLRAQGLQVRTDTATTDRMADAQRVVEFYERVIRTEPWLHIIARPGPGGDGMEVSFRIEATHAPTQYEWAFGDGDTSVVAEPIHRYGAPGTYRVAVTVDGPLGREHKRVRSVSVPLWPAARIGVEP